MAMLFKLDVSFCMIFTCILLLRYIVTECKSINSGSAITQVHATVCMPDMYIVNDSFPYHAAQDGCLLTNSENGLPFFQGYDELGAGAPDSRIHHQHQAIVPSYEFNCCGNITEWGVDLNPDTGTFDFILQVWRPSPQTSLNSTKCYSLVDYFITKSIQTTKITRVAIVTPNIQDQLQFQHGDVLGFYVESHGSGDQPGGDDDNGVVLLSNANHTSELVWFASIDITSARTQSQYGSCPYPVGTNGVLNSFTPAAPVISVSVMITSCCSSHAPFTTNHYYQVYPTSTNLAPTEIDSYHEDPSSSITHVMRILIAVSVTVVVILVTITTMTVLYCIKRKGIHVGIRHNEQLHTETQTEENYYDYPGVETVPPIQLQDNEAYKVLQGTHSVMKNIACVTVNATLPSIELKENVAYA